MKNTFFKIAIVSLLTFYFINFQTAFAQVPQAINFQAIARDGSGNPMVNTNIQIRLSVVDSAQSGTIVYQELRALQTNAYGSFSFLIGVNPAFTTIGTFPEINWGTGNKHLKIDYDPTNTFSFSLTLGTIRFVTVPYAFAAETVVYIDATGAQNGDALVYNSTTGKFEPGQVSAGTIEWSNVQNKPNFATVATSGSYNDLTNLPTLNIANWNTAFGWGNHSGLYRPITWVPAWNNITGTPTTLAGYGITNAMNTSHVANAITATNIANWNTAFGWGNHTGLYRPISYVPAWAEITANPFAFNAPSNNQMIKYNSTTSKWENWTPNFLSTEVDGSVTNEIQTISRSGDTLKLSNNGGNVIARQSQWTTSTNDIFYNGAVGINFNPTLNPMNKSLIVKCLPPDGTYWNYAGLWFVEGTANGAYAGCYLNSDKNFVISTYSNIAGAFQDNFSIDHNYGRIGIGTTTPEMLLHLKNNNGVSGIRIECNNYLSDIGTVYNTNQYFMNSVPGDFCLRANVGKKIILGASDGNTSGTLIISSTNNIGIGTANPTSKLQVVGLPEYADNAAALAAGLTIGAFYRTGDLLKVVH